MVSGPFRRAARVITARRAARVITAPAPLLLGGGLEARALRVLLGLRGPRVLLGGGLEAGRLVLLTLGDRSGLLLLDGPGVCWVLPRVPSSLKSTSGLARMVGSSTWK